MSARLGLKFNHMMCMWKPQPGLNVTQWPKLPERLRTLNELEFQAYANSPVRRIGLKFQPVSNSACFSM